MKRAFGELELSILYILQNGDRKTVKEVHSLLGEKDKYNTIMTVMNRLVEKNRLGRERKGLQYLYWITTDAKLPSIAQVIKEKFFGIKSTKLVSHLIDTDMSDEDLSEIEKMVQEAKLKRKRDA